MNFNFFVSPQKDEIIDTTIHINQNIKTALIGHVLNINEEPIKDAFLIVYEVEKNSHKQLKMKSFGYTDEWGSFALSPLEVGKLYNVKVYANNENLRTLENNLD